MTFARFRQLMDQSSSFFSRENIHRAGWAAIVLVVCGFGLARLYDKFNPPPPLIVTVMESGAKAGPAISPTDVHALTEEMKRLRETFGRQSQEPVTSKARSSAASSRTQPSVTAPDLETATQRVNALEKETKRLTDAIAKEQATASVAKPEMRTPAQAVTPAAAQSPPPPSPLPRPTFHLPPPVKGYRVVPFIGVVEATCPTDLLKQKDPIQLSFGVADQTLPTTATPLFVRIIRMRGKEYELQVVERQLDFHSETNQLSLAVDLRPGAYEIIYGFYLLAELGQEFPNFYSRTCLVTVVQG